MQKHRHDMMTRYIHMAGCAFVDLCSPTLCTRQHSTTQLPAHSLRSAAHWCHGELRQGDLTVLLSGLIPGAMPLGACKPRGRNWTAYLTDSAESHKGCGVMDPPQEAEP